MAPDSLIKTKVINLALQGGGAHGAFAWGVLDKLLEDGRIDVEGICATSAGSMNACAYAYGMLLNGREGARDKLEEFWYKIHQSGQFGNFHTHNPLDHFLSPFIKEKMDEMSYAALNQMIRTFSPYEWNPFDINPLRDVLSEIIDFDHLKTATQSKLFISTTHVRSGKVRVFRTDEISLDVVMASACLPLLFKAVEIDGESYWDGGYMGNPSLFPLFNNTQSRDLVIIHINPLDRDETPKTSPEIINRINEISFNSSLYKEIRAIAFVKKLKEFNMLHPDFDDRFKDVLVHSVRAEAAMHGLNDTTRLSSDWSFLTMLRDRGRETMQDWLDENFDHIGQIDTVDLHEEFMSSITHMFDK